MRISTLAVAVWSLAALVHAQSITVSPSVVNPGTTLTAVVSGTPTVPLHLNGTRAFLLTATGDLVTPRFKQGHTTTFTATGPPGETAQLQVPASGPGSTGSHVLFVPNSTTISGPSGPPGFAGLAARIDVGAPTPGFPALHPFPINLVSGFGSYATFGLSILGPAEWCFANTSPVPITLGPTDVARVFVPGGTAPLVTTSLTGITIPPSQVISFVIIGAALPAAPYTVQIDWLDPFVGAASVRTGIRGSNLGFGADLHLPAGRTVAPGGSLDVYADIPALSGAPSFFLLVGYQPGSTTVPGGAVVPLVPDELVLASLAGSLAPYLPGASGTAVPFGPACAGYCGPGTIATSLASGISVTHPGPVASGLVLRLALVAFVAPGQWIPTQGQEITLL